MHPRFCPHCSLELTGDALSAFPPVAMPCPQCRLVIAAGRARTAPARARDGQGRASAANVVGNAARRGEVEAGDPSTVQGAIRRVADGLGRRPRRLRMLDYQAARDADPELPTLATVVATYGTWKAARSAAADVAPAPAA